MPSLILLIAFGLGIAFFATQNTGAVHIVLGNYVLTNIPLYTIVVGSILFGVFVSWLVNIVDTLFTLFTLRNKDSLLKKSQHTMEKLQEKNFELEKEIAQLKENTNVPDQEDSEKKDVNYEPELLKSFKHGLNLSQQ